MASPSAFPSPATTAEADWISFISDLPDLAISNRRVVAVAPHPDDETLAVGAMLAELAIRDVDVTIVAVTDGEASHPHEADLAARRRAEQYAACSALGFDDAVVRLGLPDGSVEHHRDQLARILRAHTDADTVLIAPWERDGHTDHDAAGAVAHRLAVDVGASLLAYPVWAWQWATVSDLEDLPLRKVSVSDEAREAKDAALGCYPSQLSTTDEQAVVGPEAMAHFTRPWEVVVHAQ